MPIYEFHCKECEKDFERLVASTRWQGTECPHCGSKKIEKKLSVFASNTAGGSKQASAPRCATNPSRACGCVGPRHHH